MFLKTISSDNSQKLISELQCYYKIGKRQEEIF